MKNSTLFTILGGIVAGILSYWFNAYNETIAFGISIYIIMFGSNLIAAFVSAYTFDVETRKVILFTLVGMLIGIASRIVWDTTQIPTSHNLFPFEIMVVLFVSAPGSLIGALVGDKMNSKKNEH